MTLKPGTHLGPYEITAPLGAGGMGEVYRATDTNLKRQVAIKVLPPTVAGDAERLARFQREAEILAALNHPNIAHIHGLEKSDGTVALVMELVEGPTLADRIATGPIPLDEALPIAKQIAEALEAAHEQGIVHRDLKPANIKVKADGAVKVLDFGLAKAMDPVGASIASLSISPTITAPAMTQAGMILGTAAYMSPEQARGKALDARTDIWAFGCVGYEMLTGRPAFTGETITDILSAIVKSDPDWATLPRGTPSSICRLLRRCLAKEPNERLRAVADARLEIADARVEPAVGTPATSSTSRRERLLWSLSGAALVLAVATVPAARYFRTATSVQADAPEMRLQVVTPPTTDPISLALSPDGLRLVFVASGGDGRGRLWLRSLTDVTAQPLAGTEGAIYPFWSPDSKSIGFFAEGKLKRIDIGSSQPQVLAEAAGVRGGTWNRDGVILFAPTATTGLFRVLASGSGGAVPVTRVEPHQTGHRFPQFLPDGRQYLYFAQGSRDVQGVYLGALDSRVTSRLTEADSAAVYAPPGYILYVRQGALVAKRFDAATGTLSGGSVTVADSVSFDSGVNIGGVSVAAAGAIAHRSGGSGRRQLTWFDRQGRPVGTIGPPDENNLNYPELSPDGHRVVVDRTVQDNRDIWLIDVSRGVPQRFTSDPNVDSYAIWSPDGGRIVFRSNREGTFNVYQKPTSNGATETVLLASDQTKFVNDWSSDGQFLLYATSDPKTSNDIWFVPMPGTASVSRGPLKGSPFVNTAADEQSGQFSPDGHWVAYQSNDTGPTEIYLQPFPGPGSPTRVSTGGGIWPRWRADGRELFYIAPDGKLMSVPILWTKSTPLLGTPLVLFQTRMVGVSGGYSRPHYDVAADGRFLINYSLEDTASPITIILNWKPK